MKKSIEKEIHTTLFLPNFCNIYTFFLTIVLTELLAFVLVLTPLSKIYFDWHYVRQNLLTDLALISFFMQWITVLSTGTLCVIRRWLIQADNNVIMGLIAYVLILIITFIVSEFAWKIDEILSFVDFDLIHQHFLLKNSVIGILIWALIGGMLYRLNVLKKSTLIFSFAIIWIAILLLSELAESLSSSPQLQESAAQHHLFLLRNFGISMIISGIILRYFYIQHQWKKTIESIAHARFQALQSRTRPHFLFNSMNTIASLIRLYPDKAERTIEDLADLLRASLNDMSQKVTLQQELTLCNQYLNIEKLRLEERLGILWQIDHLPQDALLPPLSIQPLLENAIYHGIQLLPLGGIVRITGIFDGKNIRIDIENPFVNQSSPSQAEGNKIAQENIRKRLWICYGKYAKLQVNINNNIYCASLYFPYEK